MLKVVLSLHAAFNMLYLSFEQKSLASLKPVETVSRVRLNHLVNKPPGYCFLGVPRFSLGKTTGQFVSFSGQIVFQTSFLSLSIYSLEYLITVF